MGKDNQADMDIDNTVGDNVTGTRQNREYELGTSEKQDLKRQKVDNIKIGG